MRKAILIIFCFFTIYSLTLYADENTGGGVDEDSLFSDDMIDSEGTADEGKDEATDKTSEDDIFGNDMVEEYDKSKLDTGLENILLKNDTVELGGVFKFYLSPSWTWMQPDLTPDYIFNNITHADNADLTTTLQARIFIDARPDENFRVFLKTEMTAPFDISAAQDSNKIITNIEDYFVIKELFADFNWKNTIYFRAGKQTIKWGVGYFFSPVDVLNLTPIDPEDPEAEREGPVALKTQVPLGIHNLYLYLLAEGVSAPEDIAVAPKFEFVTGNLETGIGGFYQFDSPPVGVLTLSYPVTSALDMFAEGMVSYGATKLFLDDTGSGIEVIERNDEFFFSGSIGFLFLLNQINSEWESVVFAGQYLYNGYGYSDPSIFDNQMEIGILIASEEISLQDLMQTGMHYIACSLSWNGIFDSDFNASIFWMSNLSDGSGRIAPSVSWNIMDYMNASIQFPIAYGGEYDEFSVFGQSFGISLDISLGSGSF